MPDETARRYLFVAIDRATRWAHVRIYADQSEASSTRFLRSLMKASPMRITRILTDNGSKERIAGTADTARSLKSSR